MAYPANSAAASWRERVFAYGFAMAISLLALQVRVSLSPWLGDRPLLLLYLLPIIFSAYVGGLATGLLATGVCGVGVFWLFFAHLHILWFEGSVELWNWVMFLVIGVLVSLVIDSLHRAQRSNQAAARLYSVTLASIGDAVITTDDRGRVTFLNAEAERLTEWHQAEARGRPLPDIFRIINEETRQTVVDPATRVLESGKVVGLANHTLLLGRNGRETIIDDSGAPIQEPSGRVVGVVLVFRDCTEKKRAADALGESQALYHSLVEQMPAGVFRKDLAGRYVFVNAFFCQLRGSTADQYLGKLPAELPASEAGFRREAENHHQHILRTGETLRIQDEYHHADGRVLHFYVVKSPVFDSRGGIVGTQGVLFDVTRRKLEEEQLARSLSLLQTTIEATDNGLLVVDRQLRVTAYNRRFLEMWSIPPELAAAGNDQPILRAVQEQVADPVGFVRRVEEHYAHADQDSADTIVCLDGRLIERVSHPQRLGEEIIGRVWSFRDITERTRVEQQLQHLAFIVESSEDAIFGASLDGLITSWNQGAETIFGYPAAEIIGQSVLRFYPPEILSDREMILARITRGESVEHYQAERVRKDGRRIRISATISPLRESGGRVVGSAAIVRDVTRQHLLEEQLRQSQKMEAIGQLAGGVAHDFNNILAVIQMQIELCRVDPRFSAEQSACLDEIMTAASRGANLTRQLLLFSRRQRLQPRNLDLSESIAGMAKMLRRILGEDIQIQLKYDAHLFIHADAGMVDQVLMNLTLNSRDAMPEGGRLMIEAAAADLDELAVTSFPQARPGAFVRLQVSDTGCGIRPEILPRIFEPFFTTKDVGKGTGLGLATVFSIVQQHQGWIQVVSEPGRGSTFSIYLPRVAGDPLAAAPVAALSAVPGGGETILIVEDDQALRESVRQCLSQLGYRLLEADCGAAALEVWRQHPHQIQLLLTDVVMPGGLTGKELGERLQREDPCLKVVYVSGYSSDIFTRDYQSAPEVAFLAKPFPAQLLAQTIRACLDKKAAG